MSPLVANHRELRLKMVKLLDSVSSHKLLTRSERKKVADLLRTTLLSLLDESRSPELERIYEKHAGASFDEHNKEGVDFMRDFMRETLDIDVDVEARSAEDFARAMHEKLLAEDLAQSAKEERRRNRGKKALKREAIRAEAEKGATMSMREVYRKLVAQLHPDREADPAERARKTELMQQINKAYEARDLLTLLALQLKIEQINPSDLAGIARERLVHYNRVLSEQLQQLREELAMVTGPYEDFRSGRELTQADIRRGMEAECVALEHAMDITAADLVSFRDIAKLKRSLKSYRVGDTMSAQLDDLDEMLFSELFTPRRR